MPIHPADRYKELYPELLDKHGKPKEFSIDFLPSLDKCIWGLSRKQLVVAAGRTSMGKSVFLVQLAYSLAKQGKRVAFFSLEMTADNCILRMMNLTCGISNWVNIVGISAEEDKAYKPRMTKFQQELDNMRLAIYESYGKTFDEINDSIEQLGGEVDVVIIDYVQMIKGGGKATDKQAIDEYIKQLRELAIKKNFCAIIGSQINRATYYKDGKIKKPELWELKGTGCLEEVADIAILVHWQHHYDADDSPEDEYWIKVAKNRNGRTGQFDCKFEPEYYRLSEYTLAEKLKKEDEKKEG